MPDSVSDLICPPNHADAARCRAATRSRSSVSARRLATLEALGRDEEARDLYDLGLSFDTAARVLNGMSKQGSGYPVRKMTARYGGRFAAENTTFVGFAWVETAF